MTALLSFVLIHERLHRLQWLGICSSLCGALYLLSNGSLAAILTLSFNIGDVLFFTSQVAWALYSIIVVRIIDAVSPFAIVADIKAQRQYGRKRTVAEQVQRAA